MHKSKKQKERKVSTLEERCLDSFVTLILLTIQKDARFPVVDCVGEEVTCQQVQVPAYRRSELATATGYQKLLQIKIPEN